MWGLDNLPPRLGRGFYNLFGEGGSFTGVEEYDEMFDSPLLFVHASFGILALAISGLLAYASGLSAFATIMFLAPFCLVTWTISLGTDWRDWEDEVYSRTAAAIILGFLGVILWGFFVAILFSPLQVQLQPAKWLGYWSLAIPLEITPVVAFGLTLFNSLFLVPTSEQGLQAMLMPFFHLDSMNVEGLPFALQPPVAMGVGIWAVAHTIIGQFPWWYFISALGAGLIMMQVSAWSGNYWAGIMVHAMNNLVAYLASSLVIGGVVR